MGSLAVIALALLSNGVVLWARSGLPGFAAGSLLTCLLPGYLLIQAIFPRREAMDGLERTMLSLGAGYASLIVGGLLLHYLPGPITSHLILLTYDALILLLLIPYSRRQPSARAAAPVPKEILLQAVMVVAVAAFFRLTHLGYSEFQGDEARAMLLAAGVLRGQDDILFFHKKGPAEVLLPAAFYGLQGTTEEFTARLPFALASLTGILAIYVLARRLFPRHPLAPLVAAGLLAVDGYLVAFARIVQYQSVVFLMMALAAWCFYRWYHHPEPKLAMLSAGIVAVGALAHYEAVLVIPFMVWLFWERGRWAGWSPLEWMRQALGPTLVFAVIAGVFYVPFVLHPHFSRTAEYITERRIGEGLLYNNLSQFFHLATFYNSTYYLLFLILAVLALIIDQLRRGVRPMMLAIAVQVVLAGGLMTAILLPQALATGGINLAFLPFAATLATLMAARSLSAELKATFLWFGVPFVIATFLTLKPNTHFYTMFPAWAILAGVATSHLITAFSNEPAISRRRSRVVLAVFAVLLALFGYYIYIVFVRHTPDYRRGYPATRPAWYPVVYGDTVPKGGVFGFPHRGGWKAIGALYAQGLLQGSYSANEEPLITSWYTRRAVWCRDNADYYFITSVIHDIESIPVNRIRKENSLWGRIWSDGQPLLEIYSRQPATSPRDYQLAELEPIFDAMTQPDLPLWALKEPVPQHRVDARLGERTRLVGFDAPPQVVAGGVLPLVLYWESLAPFDRQYNVFVHIEVEGEHIWGQRDGIPACGRQPTTGWEPGELVIDGHSLPVDPATPPGEYPLLVGLYDPTTGERLPVVGRDVNPYGNAAYLGTVRIVAATSYEGVQEVGP